MAIKTLVSRKLRLLFEDVCSIVRADRFLTAGLLREADSIDAPAGLHGCSRTCVRVFVGVVEKNVGTMQNSTVKS